MNLLRFSLFLFFSQLLSTAYASNNQADQLPRLGDPLSTIMSRHEEKDLGKKFLRQLRSQLIIIDNPYIQEYIEDLLYRLLPQSKIMDAELEVILIKDETINAFAAPGGIIGIHTGLILAANTLDEFASVLSHELAHLEQRHFLRRLDHANRQQPLYLLGLLAGIFLLGASEQADAGYAAIISTNAAAISNSLAYSREHEREADRRAIQILTDSGFNPHAMPAFFWKLHKKYNNSSYRFAEYLQTHPLTETRISESLARAQKHPFTKKDNQLDFALIQSKIEQEHEKVTQALINKYNKTLQAKDVNTNVSSQARYVLAHAYMKEKDYAATNKHIKVLLSSQQNHLPYLLLDASLSVSEGKLNLAMKKVKNALKFHSGNYPLKVLLAKILMQLNRGKESSEVLKSLLQKRSSDPFIWNLLSQAYLYAGADYTVEIYHAKAEYLFLIGRIELAIKQLEYALPLIMKNAPLKGKVEKRLSELKSLHQIEKGLL